LKLAPKSLKLPGDLDSPTHRGPAPDQEEYAGSEPQLDVRLAIEIEKLVAFSIHYYDFLRRCPSKYWFELDRSPRLPRHEYRFGMRRE
jgi:hypothetical protein